MHVIKFARHKKTTNKILFIVQLVHMFFFNPTSTDLFQLVDAQVKFLYQGSHRRYIGFSLPKKKNTECVDNFNTHFGIIIVLNSLT